MKLKSLKEMGLPKGARLTFDMKVRICKAALTEKFGKRADAQITREIELMNCAHEYTHTKEKWDTLLAGMRAFGSGVELHELKQDLYRQDVVIPLELVFSKPRFREYFGAEWERCHVRRSYPKNLKQALNKSEFDSVEKVTLGHQGARFSNRLVLHCPEQFSGLLSEDVFPFSEVKPYQARVEAYLDLPEPLLIKILDHCIAGRKLKEKCDEAENKLMQVLNGYSSLITLCNTFEEFIPWAKVACSGLVDGKEAPRCSDLPAADSMHEALKILK